MLDSELKDAFNRVERFIETHYDIPVSICDVLDPNTGDFDGASIQVDYDQDLEMALFVLIHLFGHTVQWNVSDTLRHLGQASQTGGKSDEELRLIYAYERDAYERDAMIRTDSHKYALDQRGEGYMLYDLVEDPQEQRNLIGHPDMVAVEEALRDRILRFLLETPCRLE